MAKKVAVVVAGSWGTALASVLAKKHDEVFLWTRTKEQALEINERHTNKRYLPGATLSTNIHATTDMSEAVQQAAAIVIASPSMSFRSVVSMLKHEYTKDMLLIHATKGFEKHTVKRMSVVISEELDCSTKDVVVLSGPSHAEEVITDCPTTVVVACEKETNAIRAQQLFMNRFFRVYTSQDTLGIELAGAFKNIVAVAAGMSDGLGFGDNAKAALLTRGLAEMMRIGIELGASPFTFAGLAGIGDVVVTSTSKHSRNWRAGFLLGQGKRVEEVLDSMDMVVEGIWTIEAAYLISQKHNVQMPIVDQLYRVLFKDAKPRDIVEALMNRDPKTEMEWVQQSLNRSATKG